jgi:hypothetical protein
MIEILRGFPGEALNRIVRSIVTTDSRRRAIHEGRAYNMDFYDTIGAGSVYTFWGKNTGDKNIHLDEIYMNPGNFLIDFIDEGVFTLSGSPYTLVADETEGSPTYNKMVSHNLNKTKDNEATFKVFVQPAALVKTSGEIFAREYNQSTASGTTQWIIGPGQNFTAQFKNLGTASATYFLRLRWSEVTV